MQKHRGTTLTMRLHTVRSYNFRKTVSEKTLVLMVATFAIVGCTSQPSTYADKSTPNQRDIEATGAAATEAARSNSSQNSDIKIESNVTTGKTMKTSQKEAIDYRQLPGVCCAYNADGTRDHKREHEIYIDKQYAKQQRERGETYGGSASQRASTEFDRRAKHK